VLQRVLSHAGLAVLVLADAALVGYTLERHAHPPSFAAPAAVSQSNSTAQPPPAPVAITGVVAAVRADGSLLTVGTSPVCSPRSAVGPQVVQAIAPGGGLEAGLGGDCKLGVWKSAGGSGWRPVSVPVSGTVGLAADSVWWADSGVHVAPLSGAARTATNPCVASAMPVKFVVPSSATTAALVCAGAPSAKGQARLVYSTRDGGKTWSQPSGAYTAGVPGRVDGLDSTGSLVSVASLGGTSVGALLAGAGCPGLQLRTSTDLGANWTVGGCLPADVPASAVLAGGSGRTYAAAVVSGAVTAWQLTSGHWTAVA
jgi:hypothetical protein